MWALWILPHLWPTVVRYSGRLHGAFAAALSQSSNSAGMGCWYGLLVWAGMGFVFNANHELTVGRRAFMFGVAPRQDAIGC